MHIGYSTQLSGRCSDCRASAVAPPEGCGLGGGIVLLSYDSVRVDRDDAHDSEVTGAYGESAWEVVS